MAKKTPTPGILSPSLQRLHYELQISNMDVLLTFWDEIARQGTPIIEPGSDGNSLVTFVWRDGGSTRSVAVIQDWGADGIREHLMTLLPGSDVWYLTRTMPSDTRTTYQLSPSSFSDSSTPAPYLLDPLNPQKYPVYLSESGTGSDILFSLLELPTAPGLPWRHHNSINAGSVQLHTPFADQRRLWVYLPPIRENTPLPLLVVFDGRMYKDQLKLPEMLDYLIDLNLIPATAAVLIDNIDRSELLCRPGFADYIAGEVIPWLQASYPVTVEPSRAIIMGSSYGGLAAVYCAFRYPNIFGNVLSLTGWFRWRPEGDPLHHWMARQLAAAPKLPLRFWLQVGNLETAQMADGGPSQLAANRYLRDTLEIKGYVVSYQEYSGGHDVSSLEYPLAQTLITILK